MKKHWSPLVRRWLAKKKDREEIERIEYKTTPLLMTLGVMCATARRVAEGPPAVTCATARRVAEGPPAAGLEELPP